MLDLHYTTLKFFVNRLFSDISVSQGGVVGFVITTIANLQRNLPVKNILIIG